MDVYLLLFMLLLLTMFVFIRIRTYRLTTLGFFYVVIWTFLSLIICLIQGYYVSVLAFASHVLLAFSFFIPSVIVNRKTRCYKIVINNVFIYTIAFNIIGFIGLVSHVSQFGFKLELLEVGKLASESRYSGEGVSMLQVIGSSFLFVNAFIFSFSDSLNRKVLISSLITLILIVMIAILTSSKASLLMSLTFYLSGYIIKGILGNKVILISEKTNIIRKLLLIIFVVVSFSVILQLIRYGGDSSMLDIALEKIIIYAFGQFSSYSVWFDESNVNLLSGIPGYGIFTGIFAKIFGFERISGFYDSFTYISGDSYTNVFTLSRFLISDFTFIGACIFLFWVGILYEFVSIAKIPIGVKVFFLSLLSIEIIFGFSTSILSYNNVLFSLTLIMIFFQLNAKVIRS